MADFETYKQQYYDFHRLARLIRKCKWAAKVLLAGSEWEVRVLQFWGKKNVYNVSEVVGWMNKGEIQISCSTLTFCRNILKWELVLRFEVMLRGRKILRCATYFLHFIRTLEPNAVSRLNAGKQAEDTILYFTANFQTTSFRFNVQQTNTILCSTHYHLIVFVFNQQSDHHRSLHSCS